MIEQASTTNGSPRLRVISWNLGYWTPGSFKSVRNRRRQWSLLLALDADILLLQECEPDGLAELGPAWALDEYTVLAAPRDERKQAASVIAARTALHPTLVTPADALFRYLSPYVIRGTVSVEGVGPVNLASVHAAALEVDDPAVSDDDHAAMCQPGTDRAWHCDVAAHALHDWVGDSFVVGGDWNTARLFSETYPRKWAGAAAFFDMLREWGWDETMRQVHPDEIRTFLRDDTAPYQLDHLFTDGGTAARLTACEVIDDPLIRELSDHAPIVADFVVV